MSLEKGGRSSAQHSGMWARLHWLLEENRDLPCRSDSGHTPAIDVSFRFHASRPIGSHTTSTISLSPHIYIYAISPACDLQTTKQAHHNDKLSYTRFDFFLYHHPKNQKDSRQHSIMYSISLLLLLVSIDSSDGVQTAEGHLSRRQTSTPVALWGACNYPSQGINGPLPCASGGECICKDDSTCRTMIVR